MGFDEPPPIGDPGAKVIANEPPPDIPYDAPFDDRWAPSDDGGDSYGGEYQQGSRNAGGGRGSAADGRGSWTPNRGGGRPGQGSGNRFGSPREQPRPNARTSGRASSASLVAKAASDRSAAAELEVLRWVLADAGRVLPWLDASLFSDPILRAAFDLAVEEPDLPAAAELVAERGDDPVDVQALNLLYRLAVEQPTHEPDDAVSRVVGNATARAIADLAAAAAAGVDDERVDVSAVGHLKLLQGRLNEPDPVARTEALGLLVPWLTAWGRRT